MSKLTFACNLFLFRHGLHGKHRFSLFFSVKSTKSVPKRNHQMYFDTLSFFCIIKTFIWRLWQSYCLQRTDASFRSWRWCAA
ncbi:hypothetical protein DW668_06040 [Bacteroides stercoris]|uniref:Uncharacterized protein n=1 Tax=Bacteroides stercoris TaxID=46506 RepID=A0A414Q6V0_BACSE|nr:hypothetical protein DW668_06040 [Bacteroides stercoris]